MRSVAPIRHSLVVPGPTTPLARFERVRREMRSGGTELDPCGMRRPARARHQSGCSGSFLFQGGLDSHAPPPTASSACLAGSRAVRYDQLSGRLIPAIAVFISSFVYNVRYLFHLNNLHFRLPLRSVAVGVSSSAPPSIPRPALIAQLATDSAHERPWRS